VERVHRLLALLPELRASGLLDASGGSFAVRASTGLHISPHQAGPQLRWKLAPDDLVLFPGPGEASMARAGRQPCRDNRFHRAVLAARPDWNCSFHCHSWGLLAFALAGKALRVPLEHASLFDIQREFEVPWLAPDQTAFPLGGDQIVAQLGLNFGKQAHGAVLLGDHGPLVAGIELETTLGLAELLEQLARAQRWTLGPATTG
jgi:ribulose-5-phosphate 4-epimerase/fuculose-1-phosphate aldolase